MKHINISLDTVVSKITNVLDLRSNNNLTEEKDIVALEEYMSIDTIKLEEDLKFYKQLQQGYLELPQLKWNKQELLDIVGQLDYENKWEIHKPYPHTFHRGNNFATATVSSVPDVIKNQFAMQIFDSSGFANIYPNSETPPHIDEGYDKSLNKNKSFIEDGRECAIFFPVFGDFKLAPTELYKVMEDDKKEIGIDGLKPRDWSDEHLSNFSKYKISTITFEHPTLIRTKGNIWHGVNNVSDSMRITYQISFKSPYTFESIAQMIRMGLING